ncbi:MAG: GGDEF domain-containing protein, partial [Ralstonia sp.]
IAHAGSVVAGHVTVSVGVAGGWALDGALPHVLVKTANDALLAAKAGGRNRVVVVPMPPQLMRGVVTA